MAYTGYTVDMVYTVEMVYTVDTVYTFDTGDEGDHYEKDQAEA